jgi:hypothetical protein
MQTALTSLVFGALLLSACSSGEPVASPQSPDALAPATPSASPARLSPAARAALRLGADWTTYGGDASRSSHLSTGPSPRRARAAWSASLDGSVYASPLVVGGTVIAATENNTLYGLA